MFCVCVCVCVYVLCVCVCVCVYVLCVCVCVCIHANRSTIMMLLANMDPEGTKLRKKHFQCWPMIIIKQTREYIIKQAT